jgi:hypothetical protein
MFWPSLSNSVVVREPFGEPLMEEMAASTLTHGRAFLRRLVDSDKCPSLDQKQQNAMSCIEANHPCTLLLHQMLRSVCAVDHARNLTRRCRCFGVARQHPLRPV